MTATLRNLLRGGSISTLFQPIYDVRSDCFQVWALEALSRGPAGTHFEPASIFFEYVRLRHEEVRVDRCCILNALARRASLPADTRLSVNIHASTLERDPAFVSFIESAAVASDIAPSTLIIELVEQTSYVDRARTSGVLRDLRSIGVGIAIDDLGLGYGNYRTILDMQPEYLKIDRYFVDGIASDWRRQSLVRSVLQIAKDFGALTVAEGVEEAVDLALLREMEVPLVQGYLLALPGAEANLAPIEAQTLGSWSSQPERMTG